MTFTIVPPPRTFLAANDFSIDPLLLQATELPSELTVAQAAQILDMPEGGILEMFKLGILDCRQEGTRRFTDRDKLLEYKREYDRLGVALDEMVRENQEMGFYDD